MMTSYEQYTLYHPQEITSNPTGALYQHSFLVHHLTGNIFEQTKSRVESLTELQTKLLNWMKPMGIQERQEKLTFISPDFVNLVKKMFQRRCYYNEHVFRLVQDPYSGKLEVIGKEGGVTVRKNNFKKAEEDLLQGIIFLHKHSPFDSITLSEGLLHNIETLFELFSIIVDGITFQITEQDCMRLKELGPQNFFYEPEETPYYLQSLGKFLVSVFTQHLWCEYYFSIQNPGFKRPKDKDKKKINNFWREQTLSKKLEVLQIIHPQDFIQRIRKQQLNHSKTRVSKFKSQQQLRCNQVEQYIKNVAHFNGHDFYDSMKKCPLRDSHRPEMQMGWFIIAKIKDHLLKRYEMNQIKVINLFKKGKEKRKKETVNQIQKQKPQKPQPQIIKQKPTPSLTLTAQSSTKTYQQDKQVQKNNNKMPKNHHKNNKHSNKRKKMYLKRKINLLLSEEQEGQKSKRQTSASSPRISEISNQPKLTISQSDVQAPQYHPEWKLQHQPSCCQFGSQDKNQDLVMMNVLDLEENFEQNLQPTQQQIQDRRKQLELLKWKLLNKTVDYYALRLKEMAYKLQYSRMVAFNRLLYILSPFGVTLNVFGSWATGLVLDDSDIDLAVGPFILNYFVSCFGTTKDKIVSALHSIKSMLQSRSWVKIHKFLDQAQVPVLKFSIDTNIGFQNSEQNFYNVAPDAVKSTIFVDLTIQQFQSQQKTHVGLMVSSLMNQWKQRYPCVLPICLVLKHLLKRKKMGDAYTGGLSPYCVMIMLVSFLKHSGLTKCNESGKVLLEFLQFYIQSFNYRNMGIDVISQEDSPFFSKQSSQGLCIVEPISRKLIKSTYSALPDIIQYFRVISNELLSCVDDLETLGDPRVVLPQEEEYENILLMNYPL